MQSHSILNNYPIPYKISPFRHNMGWDQLKKELDEAGYDPRKHFLFGDKYQMSSVLSFYSIGPETGLFFKFAWRP